MAAQYQIGDVQDASADLTYNEATTYTDAATSRFPQAVGYHQGKATLKLTVRDFNPLLFTAMQNCGGNSAERDGDGVQSGERGLYDLLVRQWDASGGVRALLCRAG